MEGKTLNCILLGAKSDIATAIQPMLETEYKVFQWSRYQRLPREQWDLLVCCLGAVSPVGNWWGLYADEWKSCITSNLLLPFRFLQQLWEFHNPNASICFFAGSNPNSIMKGYLPYNVSKMALLKLVEQLDFETEDAKFFALGPGVTDTKIHHATKEAKWPNPRLERALKDGSFTKMEDIYACLKWCISQPKEVVGGRNICVSDLERLKTEAVPKDFGKLRRVE